MHTQKLNWGILGAARVNERLLPAIIEAANAPVSYTHLDVYKRQHSYQ